MVVASRVGAGGRRAGIGGGAWWMRSWERPAALVDGLVLAYVDRRLEVERRDELGAVSLEDPGGALLARRVPAEELLEHLSVRAGERRFGKVGEEGHHVVQRRVRS